MSTTTIPTTSTRTDVYTRITAHVVAKLARVEIPDTDIGPDREDLFYVAYCQECDTGFDFDYADLTEDPQQSPVWP